MIYVSRYVDVHGNPLGAIPAPLPTSMELIGPFRDRDSACLWAQDPRNNPGDDPRWQLMSLRSPVLPWTHRTPE